MTRRQLLGNLTTAPFTAGAAILISGFSTSFVADWRQFAVIAGPSLLFMSVAAWVYLFATARRDPETGRFLEAGPIGFVANAVSQTIHLQSSTAPVAFTNIEVIRGGTRSPATPGKADPSKGDSNAIDGIWTEDTAAPNKES